MTEKERKRGKKKCYKDVTPERSRTRREKRGRRTVHVKVKNETGDNISNIQVIRMKINT